MSFIYRSCNFLKHLENILKFIYYFIMPVIFSPTTSYQVKLFPGTKRLDSSIQTNTWPKFNENFKFPLVPDIKYVLHDTLYTSLSKIVFD